MKVQAANFLAYKIHGNFPIVRTLLYITRAAPIG
jgi:hypothetical protein